MIRMNKWAAISVRVLLVAGCLAFSAVQGQVIVGDFRAKKGEQFSEEAMAELRGTTTIFFYRTSDVPMLEQLESEIRAGWKITPIEFHPASSIVDFKEELDTPSGYSFLIMDATKVMDVWENVYIGLILRVPSVAKKDASRPFRMMGDVPLDNSVATMNWVNTEENDFGTDFLGYLYTEATIENWRPGFLAMNLKQLSDGLERRTGVAKYDEKGIASVRSHGLLIPAYSLEQCDYKSTTIIPKKKPDDLLGHLPFKYEVLPTSELDARILEADGPLYYLTTIRRGRYFSCHVQEATTGKVVYSTICGLFEMEDAFKALGKFKEL